MPSDRNEAAQRTTFRPPWVKEVREEAAAKGPKPLPAPPPGAELKKTARRDSNTSDESPLGVTLKKVHTKEANNNGAEVAKDVTFEKPKLKPVPQKEINIPKKNKIALPKLNSVTDATENNPLVGVQLRKTSIKSSATEENGGGKEPEFIKPKLKPVPVRDTSSPPKKDHKLQLPKLNSVADRKLRDPPPRKPSLTRVPTQDDELDKEVPATRNALVRAESMRRLSQSHNMPAPPPMPPPAPAMPGAQPPLTEEKQKKLDMLRARPKARPDWSSLLKDLEGNKKLKHVHCNDRSQPLLPEAVKATDHFVFESEKDNCHNVLLKEIQFGIKLKKVKTNDRSKPILDGLRKFRRQMTIEEQIQKSISMASMPPDEIPVEEQDEMDDIDKVRDDLQSTKQMLALEMRNKEAQIRENKMLQARIQNLEAELEKAKNNKTTTSASTSVTSSSGTEDKVVKALKTEAEQAKKLSNELERKYRESTEQLDGTKQQLEEIRRQNRELEKRLQTTLGGGKRGSFSDRKNSMANGGDNSDLDFYSSEEEEQASDGEDTEEKRLKKQQKELKHMRNKLRNFKNKEDNAKKERIALREIIKRNQTAIRAEKKRFKQLQKEVDKMAALMKDEEEEEEEDDEDKIAEVTEEEEEEETSEDETSDESDSDDDSDSEKSQSEAEDAPIEKRRKNLEVRSTRHENILSALKKGNFMLKTNAERLQDELNRQKDATEGLKLDLDSVLSELG